MIDEKKKQLIEELIAHLEGSQADDLMGLVEKHKKPAIAIDIEAKPIGSDAKMDEAMGIKDSASEESAESPSEESAEMSDDELASLLKEYLH